MGNPSDPSNKSASQQLQNAQKITSNQQQLLSKVSSSDLDILFDSKDTTLLLSRPPGFPERVSFDTNNNNEGIKEQDITTVKVPQPKEIEQVSITRMDK